LNKCLKMQQLCIVVLQSIVSADCRRIYRCNQITYRPIDSSDFSGKLKRAIHRYCFSFRRVITRDMLSILVCSALRASIFIYFLYFISQVVLEVQKENSTIIQK